MPFAVLYTLWKWYCRRLVSYVDINLLFTGPIRTLYLANLEECCIMLHCVRLAVPFRQVAQGWEGLFMGITGIIPVRSLFFRERDTVDARKSDKDRAETLVYKIRFRISYNTMTIHRSSFIRFLWLFLIPKASFVILHFVNPTIHSIRPHPHAPSTPLNRHN